MKKEEKVITLKYISRWLETDGVKLPEYKYKQVMMAHTRRYHNCLFLLAGLNSSCRDLLDYLCERMDKNNSVHSNKAVREDFVGFVAGITNGYVRYSDVTVKKAFATLSDKLLLIPRGRGTYTVNPEFFSRREEKDRLDQIKVILEFNKDDVYE
jgi:hypothetical protein